MAVRYGDTTAMSADGRPETAGSADCSLQTGRSDLDLERQQGGIDFAHLGTRHRPSTAAHGRQLHGSLKITVVRRACRLGEQATKILG